jgi:hypothetical protein
MGGLGASHPPSPLSLTPGPPSSCHLLGSVAPSETLLSLAVYLWSLWPVSLCSAPALPSSLALLSTYFLNWALVYPAPRTPKLQAVHTPPRSRTPGLD